MPAARSGVLPVRALVPHSVLRLSVVPPPRWFPASCSLSRATPGPSGARCPTIGLGDPALWRAGRSAPPHPPGVRTLSPTTGPGVPWWTPSHSMRWGPTVCFRSPPFRRRCWALTKSRRATSATGWSPSSDCGASLPVLKGSTSQTFSSWGCGQRSSTARCCTFRSWWMRRRRGAFSVFACSPCIRRGSAPRPTSAPCTICVTVWNSTDLAGPAPCG